MQIEKLYLSNFKNYEEESVLFHSNINCFVGENGSGKTNLLDAIYFLLLTKSALNIDNQLIKVGSGRFVVTVNLSISDKKYFISSSLEEGKKKQFLVNKEPYKKLSNHIGRFPVVMISPYDTAIIHEGSETRRRFFDGIMAQINQEYLGKLLDYTKVLKQRNAILKNYVETRRINQDLVWSLNKQLIPLGNYILAKRAESLKYFIPEFNKLYKLISEDNENVQVAYQSQLLNTNFEELLTDSLEKDMITGRTNKGIHKDDYIFEIHHNMPLSKFGSQGQQKSFIMALKFANFNTIKEHNGFNPILLLDDIFDRIDQKRIEKLVEMVKNNCFGQIFITDTHQERIHEIFKDISEKVTTFKVQKGTIS